MGLHHAGDGALRPALGHRQRRLSLSGVPRAVPASAVVRAAGSAGGRPGREGEASESRDSVAKFLRCPEFALSSRILFSPPMEVGAATLPSLQTAN